MSDPYIGQISFFGFNFAPVNWAQCNGQLMSISQNVALFSLLGTYYGGNGTSTFALPNLQGTVPIGMGTSTTGTTYTIGETGGAESVTLMAATVPQHTHTLSAANTKANANTLAANMVPADASGSGKSGSNTQFYAQPSKGSQVSLAPAAISIAGSNQPHNNMQPTLAGTWCIALYGVFPPRS